MPEFNLLDTYPKAVRNLVSRSAQQAENRKKALEYGFEYFDGTRDQGYGGYRYDGRWVPVARKIIDRYGLTAGSRVLDIGCAKGFLVKDLGDQLPGLEAVGLDISAYAIDHCHPDVAGKLVQGNADRLPFPDDYFDAVTCINVLHNLDQPRCIQALREINRVCRDPRRAYVQVDAYRTEQERDLFESWVLTAVTYGTPEFWHRLFAEADYQGDYYWTIIEADPQWTVIGDSSSQ